MDAQYDSVHSSVKVVARVGIRARARATPNKGLLEIVPRTLLYKLYSRVATQNLVVSEHHFSCSHNSTFLLEQNFVLINPRAKFVAVLKNMEQRSPKQALSPKLSSLKP